MDIPLPFFDDNWHRPLVYGHCNGILCLVGEDKLALWNPSIRQFKILPESSVQRPPSADMTSIESVPGVWRPLGFWENGELFYENSDNELMLFDPSTRELKNLGIHAYNGPMQIIVYVESLVPLGLGSL
ncbi:hypothetical protein V6N12_012447 [Hibiscus sabdariffa]|uniref:F-box protein n=1 Tax=Hibiscus sabdariffa TaxID=183260 RepID=A0ABR1ZZL3_9ROSI